MSKPEPFFFGDSDELFGMYHVANGARRRRAVLIAEPLLNENMRAHFALRQISMKLSAAGYDVLRFDYSGMGNSLNSSNTVGPAEWKANLMTAANELQDISGVSRISIVAVRFSANLAASVTQTRPAEEFVMWDPVMKGKAWLEKLIKAQEATAKQFPYLDFDADREFLGHKMPISFCDDLLATEQDAIVAQKILRVETEDFPAGPDEDENYDVVKVPFQCNWESLSSQVLYPHKVIDEICKYLT
jgi:hypothetical protein